MTSSGRHCKRIIWGRSLYFKMWELVPVFGLMLIFLEISRDETQYSYNQQQLY